MIKQVKLKISGKVQGVCYRAEAQEKALQLNIKGFAQNNRDHSVTVVAVGEEEAIQNMIEWCHKGPSRAFVSNVEITWEPIDRSNEFQSFEIY